MSSSSSSSISSSISSLSIMMKKTINKSMQKATDFYLTVSGSPYKAMRTAIMIGDEDKAIDIYTKVKNGKSLSSDINPSSPFPIKKYMNETPLHLACIICLKKLILMFINNGGTPCAHNGRNETCLHAIVSRSDNNIERLELLDFILNWRGIEIDGISDKVSINHVDVDGNAAIHYAARSGLVYCVLRLLSVGSIISLVNKDQKTCCEMADDQNFKELAHLLELALVFQPDEDMLMNYEGHQFPNERRLGLLFLNCESINEKEVDEFIFEMICSFKDKFNFDSTHIEVLLDHYSWDSERLNKELKKNIEECISSCNLTMDAVIKESVSPPSKKHHKKKDKSKSKGSKETISINEKELLDLSQEKINEKEPNEKINEKEPLLPLPPPTTTLPITMDLSQQKEEMIQEHEKVPALMPPLPPMIHEPMKSDNDSIQQHEKVPALMPPLPPMIHEPMKSDNELVQQHEKVPALMPPLPPMIDEIMKSDIDLINTMIYDSNNNENTIRRISSDAGEPISNIAVVSLDNIFQKEIPVIEFDSKPIEKLNKRNKNGVIEIDEVCNICGDTMTKLLSLEAALRLPSSELENYAIGCNSGHRFCFTCWNGNSKIQIMDSGSYSLKCPAFKCGEILHNDWAPVILSTPDLCERLSTNRRRHIVDCCPQLKWCPVDGCDVVVRLCLPSNQSLAETNSLPQSAVCSKGHSFCISCSSAAHSPCSCDQWQEWFQKISEETKNADAKSSDDIANALWVAANTKRCPRCSTAIEKDEGCNHMSCRKCRYEFCWICMEDWTLHSNSTGGYFQCNRFVESQNESATRGMEDQSGNAHMETFRMRLQAKRMSRFIHHYTRFKAHADSTTMEMKMYGETVSRIRSEIDAVIIKNSFSWLKSDTPIVTRIKEVIDKITVETSYKTSNSEKVNDDLYLKASSGSLVSTLKGTGDVLEFLHNGYEELHKCRQILSASYAYTFFEFSEDEEYMRNSKMTIRLSYSRLDERKRSFESLQSELEFLTELLSDVVARRRLRASRSQIIQTTKAARSKRIELEDIVLSYRTSDILSSGDRKGRKSSSSRKSPGNALASFEDERDISDIAAFLSHLENQMSPARSTPAGNTSRRSTPASTNATLASRIGSSSAPSTTASTPKKPANTLETPVSIRVVNSSNRGSSRGQSSRKSNAEDFTRPRDADPLSDQGLGSPTSPINRMDNLSEMSPSQVPAVEDWHEKINRMLANQENDVDEDSILQLRARAEEEEALNAAILMSLQDSFKSSLSNTENNNNANENESLFIIKDDDLNQLLSMGFDKEQCIIALRNSNNNVDQAINRLLN